MTDATVNDFPAYRPEARLSRLKEMASHRRHCANIQRNGGNQAEDERAAQAQEKEARDIEWAVDQIENAKATDAPGVKSMKALGDVILGGDAA